MERDTICKTIHQYSRGPIPEADMEKPQAIARDYKKVKNYIWRPGGCKEPVDQDKGQGGESLWGSGGAGGQGGPGGLGQKIWQDTVYASEGSLFSGEERLGSLFRLVDTGVLDMEEVWEALLHWVAGGSWIRYMREKWEIIWTRWRLFIRTTVTVIPGNMDFKIYWDGACRADKIREYAP